MNHTVEKRQSLRKTQNEAICTINNQPKPYQVLEFAVPGLSFLCFKNECMFKKNEYLDRVTVYNNNGVVVLLAAAEVIHISSYDEAMYKIGIKYTLKTLDRLIVEKTRAPRYVPKVQMDCIVRFEDDGNTHSYLGKLQDFTSSSAKVKLRSEVIPQINVDDKIIFEVKDNENVLYSGFCRIVRKNAERSEIVIKLKEGYLDFHKIDYERVGQNDNKTREIRVSKKIPAIYEGDESFVENISKTGGFLKTKTTIPKEKFNVTLQINKYKTVQLSCHPQWSNENGVGFRVLGIEESKKDIFDAYMNKQIEQMQQFGEDRVFRTEIYVTLKDTNATGNVYFANFFQFQGIVRERILLAHIPNANQYFYETGHRLVTIDAYNKYINNAYFGDIIIAELTTSNIQASQMRLNIRFKNKATGVLIGDGYQDFCCVNRQGKVIKMPKAFDYLEFYQEVRE
jgi:acyl-CoA thioesterase FadM